MRFVSKFLLNHLAKAATLQTNETKADIKIFINGSVLHQESQNYEYPYPR